MKFNESELKIVGYTHPVANADAPVFDYPISKIDAWRDAVLKKKPCWLCTGAETFQFYPTLIPDNKCRGFLNDGGMKITNEEKGGTDMFGVEWVFIPVANGSMENPDQPHMFEDANEWKEKLQFPDIDAWDWEGCAARNKEFLNNGFFNYFTFLNGFGFERLISLMGFENAAMALLDEDQEDAMYELIGALYDLGIRLVDKIAAHFDNIHGIMMHDDWGSQRDPFFSPEVGAKFFVPHMKRFTDHIHSKGMVAELHSCGSNEKQVPNYIAGGWDAWNPMAAINDTKKLHKIYGDKIVIGVHPEEYDEATETEEEIRAKARAFVEEFCSEPGKVCVLNKFFVGKYLHGVYAEELYKASRIAYDND